MTIRIEGPNSREELKNLKELIESGEPQVVNLAHGLKRAKAFFNGKHKDQNGDEYLAFIYRTTNCEDTIMQYKLYTLCNGANDIPKPTIFEMLTYIKNDPVTGLTFDTLDKILEKRLYNTK